jgi:signal transduction histidine kinase/ActR/RegA family two-component response regulator
MAAKRTNHKRLRHSPPHVPCATLRGVSRRIWVPYLVLIVVLTATFTTGFYLYRSAEASDAVRFENRTIRIQNAIRQRLETYIAMLLGGKGLFAAAPLLSRDGFRKYVEGLDLVDRYPGIQGIGFSERIASHDLESALARIRREFPHFNIWPHDARPEYHTIVYLEPLDRRNRAALGFDMYTEPARRTAMQQAVDTGLPSVSGKVTLVQEIDETKQAGFLIYVPLYRNAVTPPTVDERRRQLSGFIYSPFRVDDFLRGLLGSAAEPDVDFQVYDENPEPAHLLHTSNGLQANILSSNSRWRTASTIAILGHRWTLVVVSRPEFELDSSRRLALWVLLGGSILAFALYALTRSESLAHARAEQRTIELNLSERALRESVVREHAAREEAEAASRVKDEFLATLSHELRTPLTPMLGWTHILRRQSDPATTEKGLEVIERSIRTQLGLIDELLDVSRIVTGKLHLTLVPMLIHAAVSMAIESMRPIAVAKNIILETDLDASPCRTFADPERLQRIILNLLSNAIKFTPPGGKIQVSLKHTHEDAWLRIADSGQGISREFLPFIFDRFRQADSSTTRLHGGLGLGLSIVKSLVNLHGGTITAESAGSGLGSIFTVRLPLRELPPRTNLGSQQVAASNRIDAQVLLVEDDADSRETFCFALRHHGATVRTATSAGEALDVLKSYRPDVLISDIAMPKMDGIEFLQHLRAAEQERGLAPLPAIALTAHAGEEDRDRILAAGFQIHLPKPVDASTLAAVIFQLIPKQNLTL